MEIRRPCWLEFFRPPMVRWPELGPNFNYRRNPYPTLLYVLSRHIAIDIEYRYNAYTNNLCCFSNNSKTNNDTPPHLIPYWTLLRQHQQHLFIMKIILTGSTGFIGGEVLAQCLKNPAITSAVVLSRRELSKEISDPRLKVIIMKSFTQYPDSVLKELAGADACIWYVNLVLLSSKFF